MSEGQPCNGRLCMDGVGADCIYTCMSSSQLLLATKIKDPPSQAFSAKFVSRCVSCRHMIQRGEMIVYREGMVEHEEC